MNGYWFCLYSRSILTNPAEHAYIG